MSYGLTSEDLKTVQKKIKNQEKYLESNTFVTSSGQSKTLAEVSFGANTSTRYYSRILNKVNTFVSLNLGRDYKAVFLTVTLDGFFRDFLKGNFIRWTDETKESYKKHIPNNDRHGHYLDLINNHTQLTQKDLYKILSHQLHRFIKSPILQQIRKNGDDYSFIRVTEPHKDGTPHFHILLYVPEEYMPSVFKAFVKFFPAPQNHKKITKKYNNRIASLIYDDIYETQGFQIAIRSSTGYILKYILKSFRNLIEDKEIDYLQAWYIHNRIPRIITTHSLIPQDIYKQVSILDNDWYYLTNVKLIDGYESDIDNNYFKFDDGHDRLIVGDSGLYTIYNKGILVKWYGKKKVRAAKYRLRSFTFTDIKPTNFKILKKYIIWIPPYKYSYYRLQTFRDHTQFCFASLNDFSLTFLDGFADTSKKDYITPVTKLSDLALFDLYNNFDFDKYHPARYAHVKNEMIDRYLLHTEHVTISDFTSCPFEIRETIEDYHNRVKDKNEEQKYNFEDDLFFYITDKEYYE